MLNFSILSSGSCGNSYIFYDGNDSIMVDMGISTKSAEERILLSSIPLDSIRAIFITHLHPDHAGDSLKTFSNKYNLKVFFSKFAAKREHRSFIRLSLDNKLVNLFTIGETKKIGNFRITSLEAFHDSEGCVSYYITNDENKICLITDTGYFSSEMIDAANDSNILFLESNYDDEMLDNGDYPAWLKNRVRSEKGHLSNEQACRFLKKLNQNLKKEVYLIHLSANNNTKEIAEKRTKECDLSFKSIIALERGQFFNKVYD